MTARVIVVQNPKGGVGKTTTAMYLARHCAEHGTTLLIGCDPQQQVLGWASAITEDGEDLPIRVVGLVTRDARRQVRRLAEDYDFIVVDTPGSTDSAVHPAQICRIADLVIIPIAPSTADMDTLKHAIDMVLEAQNDEDCLIPRVVLVTRAKRRTKSLRAIYDAVDAMGELGDDYKIRILGSPEHGHIRYLERFALGWGDQVDLDTDYAEIFTLLHQDYLSD